MLNDYERGCLKVLRSETGSLVIITGYEENLKFMRERSQSYPRMQTSGEEQPDL